MEKDIVYIYDTTLRDGAQTSGIDFSVADKIAVAKMLDAVGVDYIEAGWYGANDTDNEFFQNLPSLKNASFTSFGMTRRGNKKVKDDAGFTTLLNTDARVVTLVAKTWDLHVSEALGVSLDENVNMITDSIKYASPLMKEVNIDAEHFFDGYKANPEYALRCVTAARDAGADWIILCDTNGGTMPDEIEKIIKEVVKYVPGNHLGIHCHNDTGCAVANTLIAVECGVRQVQGTVNGLGERCGNANLNTVIPDLVLKMGYRTNITDLKMLTKLSNFLCDRLNIPKNKFAPYVGARAFAHKGGLHVSAILKNPKCYEHISPEEVGNERKILVSSQSGRSNITAILNNVGIDIESLSKETVGKILEEVKHKEFKEGITYDGAEASFELMVRRTMGEVPHYFTLDSFRVFDEMRHNEKGKLVIFSDATVKILINGKAYLEASEGDGPVDALANAMRKVLLPVYPEVDDLHLIDYKVRIINTEKGTGASPRVMVESSDKDGNRWNTVGVSKDIIDASFTALCDSFIYKLFKEGVMCKNLEDDTPA